MNTSVLTGVKKRISEGARKILFPLPEDQAKQGFEPNFYIKSLRSMSRAVSSVLRLNGVNRFSNEFIQSLDPKITINVPGAGDLVFRTGHGRLLWRAKTFLEEEPMLVDWIRKFTKDDVFYDVGSNVGSYSLLAAKLGIKSFALEPELFNVSLIYENIFLNGLQDLCTPVPIALGDTTRLDVFFLKSVSKGDALHSVGRRSYLLDDSSSHTTLNTLVIRLDDLVSWFNLPKPTRVKIDVDNNELNVVRGGLETLRDVKEVYVELDLKFDEHREVLKTMQDLGFTVKENVPCPREWNKEIGNYLFSRS